MDNINDLIGDAAKQLMAQADGIQNQKLKASAQRVAQTISAKTRDELISVARSDSYGRDTRFIKYLPITWRQKAVMGRVYSFQCTTNKDGTKVDTVKIVGVKVDSFDSKVDVNFDVKVDSDFDTGFYTDADGKSAGRQSARAENEAVKIASRPRNIDDRYKNTSTSTAVADGDGMTGSGIPTREEVRSHFAEMGFAVDPDRFFDVNEGRGWRTNSGKPVDDWKKPAATAGTDSRESRRSVPRKRLRRDLRQ